MSIIEKLEVKEILCIPCSQIKPSEAHNYTAVPHNQLKEREKVYRKLLEALIDVCLDLEESCSGRAEIEDKYDPIIQKATGKSWEEIKELL